MPPLGNDVVDLKHPENQGKSRDGRFLGRVFTVEERDHIARAARPDTLLWALWAAKEAAFKVVSRDDPAVISTPKRYHIMLDAQHERRNMSGADAAADPVTSVGGGDPGKVFCSQKIRETPFTGRAITPLGEVALRIVATDDYVHALAAETVSDLDRVFQRVDPMEADGDHGAASAFVRRALLVEIADRLDCLYGELSIGKEPRGPGAPFVLHRGRPLSIDVSLSHDGRFSAFAFIIGKKP